MRRPSNWCPRHPSPPTWPLKRCALSRARRCRYTRPSRRLGAAAQICAVDGPQPRFVPCRARVLNASPLPHPRHSPTSNGFCFLLPTAGLLPVPPGQAAGCSGRPAGCACRAGAGAPAAGGAGGNAGWSWAFMRVSAVAGGQAALGGAIADPDAAPTADPVPPGRVQGSHRCVLAAVPRARRRGGGGPGGAGQAGVRECRRRRCCCCCRRRRRCCRRRRRRCCCRCRRCRCCRCILLLTTAGALARGGL